MFEGVRELVRQESMCRKRLERLMETESNESATGVVAYSLKFPDSPKCVSARRIGEGDASAWQGRRAAGGRVEAGRGRIRRDHGVR
ncbi:MAG: hypothetical protein A2V70_13730 [Planctomycetes bacterium RBG_13_63_9]|nr:MAG: hypothetical protein A2V70_13730 [Planctomycetes bacterium RBG_13_63_9]